MKEIIDDGEGGEDVGEKENECQDSKDEELEDRAMGLIKEKSAGERERGERKERMGQEILEVTKELEETETPREITQEIPREILRELATVEQGTEQQAPVIKCGYSSTAQNALSSRASPSFLRFFQHRLSPPPP